MCIPISDQPLRKHPHSPSHPHYTWFPKPASIASIIALLESESPNFWLGSTLVITFLIRIYNLGLYPANINPDAADTIQTYLIASARGEPSFFSYNWNGAPALNMYLIGWTWDLLGQSIFGLRFLSALLSTVSIGLFFGMVSQLTGKKLLAFVTSLLLSTNPWFLNFSRDGWENIWNAIPVLLIVWGLYLLFESSKSKVALALLIVGNVLGFYFYHPGKLLAPMVMLILVIHRLRKGWPAYQLVGVLFGLTVLLIYPQLRTLLDPHQHPYKYNGWHRIKSVSLWNQSNSLSKLLENSQINLKAFLFFQTDDFSRSAINHRYLPLHIRPILTPLVILYLVGLTVGLLKYRYLVAFYLLILLPAQILSIDTPDAARAVHIVPLIFLFIALGAYQLIQAVEVYVPLKSEIFYGLMIYALLGIALFQLEEYSEWIRAPQTLHARQPAVDIHDYNSQWLHDVKQKAQDGDHLSVSDWIIRKK